MDIFKQNRNLKIAIIILALLNIGILTFFWLNRPQNLLPRELAEIQIEGPNRIKHLLKEELGFNNRQAQEYLELREDQRRKTEELNFEIRRIKKQMFDEALKNGANIAISDSLLNLAQTKQAEIEKLTFQHFVKLKNLCKPNQKDKLKLLLHRLLQPQSEGNMPPPPPPQIQ